MARHVLDRRPEARDDRFGSRLRPLRTGTVVPVPGDANGGAGTEAGLVALALLRQKRGMADEGQRTRAFLRIARGRTA